MIDSSLFPHSSFPIRLEYEEKQRGHVVCFFQCDDHLNQHLTRHQLERKKCIILKADEQSLKSSKTDKNEMVSRNTAVGVGGTSSGRKRTKKLDPLRNSNKTRKPRKKK